MPYTFELTFTGLIIFTFKGDKRHPSEVNALLVDGTHHPDPDKHKPLLSYDPRNHHRFPKPAHRLVPLPDGSQIAHQSLAGRVLEIGGIPDSVTTSITARWRDPSTDGDLPSHPRSEEEKKWLDWAMALQRMNPETPAPRDEAPYGGLEAGEVARVTLRRGELLAKGFPKELDGSYTLWDFRVPAGPVEGTHAMASSIRLKVEGLPDGHPISLTSGSNFKVVLAPARLEDGSYETEVSASVTNLPDTGQDPGSGPAPLHHFRYFYEMVKFPGPVPRLRIPHPRSAVITRDNSFCPPTTHTLAK